MSAHETGQLARAAQFRALHRGTVLVLPNAWDAGSAAVIEAAGAHAIATTSAGVSWAAGRPGRPGTGPPADDRGDRTDRRGRLRTGHRGH